MKVSVCMATYNGARNIKEQMDSILGQEFKENPDVEMEVIVSDDGSTDDTLAIIESYHDERIKIFKHTDRKLQKHYTALYAASANFANAMEKATGDYIFLSDQDDVWYPNKIDDTLEILKEKGGVVAADFDVIGVDGKKYGRMTYEEEPFWRFRRKYSPYGFSLGIAREMMKFIMPMPKVHQHDTFIYLLALRLGKMHYLHVPTAAHRWFGDENTSSSATQEPIYYKVWVRVKMYAIVFERIFVGKN